MVLRQKKGKNIPLHPFTTSDNQMFAYSIMRKARLCSQTLIFTVCFFTFLKHINGLDGAVTLFMLLKSKKFFGEVFAFLRGV